MITSTYICHTMPNMTKDTIREEWKNYHGFIVNGGDIDFENIADWWLNKLSQQKEQLLTELKKEIEKKMDYYQPHYDDMSVGIHEGLKQALSLINTSLSNE